jgi:hypothetical protein
MASQRYLGKIAFRVNEVKAGKPIPIFAQYDAGVEVRRRAGNDWSKSARAEMSVSV